MKHLYRLRRDSHWTLVQLPTPMMCFERSVFASLGNLAARQTKNKKPILEAMLTEPYQKIVSELELLGGGATDKAAGNGLRSGRFL